MDRDRQLLQYHWISFGLLVTLSMISEMFLSNYGSAWESFQRRSWHYAYMIGHIALFGVMVAATYFHRKALWWVAIVVISLKLYRLLKYYAFFDYFSSSSIYNHDYWVGSYKLGHLITPWLGLPGDLLFSNNPLSAAFLTTLYVYWLVKCRRLLHASAEAVK
jgi:hypothetical protein